MDYGVATCIGCCLEVGARCLSEGRDVRTWFASTGLIRYNHDQCARCRLLGQSRAGTKCESDGNDAHGGLQISRITGIIIGRRPVVFWISRFSSARTFSLTMP